MISSSSSSTSVGLVALIFWASVLFFKKCNGFLLPHPSSRHGKLGSMTYFDTTLTTTTTTSPHHRSHCRLNMARRRDETTEQVMEALQSLGDFHQGSWKGRATSFTVTADIAAGVVQKKQSPPYQVDVQLNLLNDSGEWAFTELFSWQKQNEETTFCSSRQLSLTKSSTDCDAVDSSYSLHVMNNNNDKRQESNTDNSSNNNNNDNNLPADISGTEKPIDFAVEHCLVVSEEERVRLFALYGTDQGLVRVVVCEEQRVPPDHSTLKPSSPMSLSASDLVELEEDVDRIVNKIAGQVQKGGNTKNNDSNSSGSSATADSQQQQQKNRLKQLKDSLQSSSSSSSSSSLSSRTTQSPKDNKGPSLSRHPISLLELTSGVWLGDSIIRDFPMVPGSNTPTTGKGFGAPPKTTTFGGGKAPDFGSWVVGVQKVAREWLWDFGEQVRQKNEAGRSLGAPMEPALGRSMGGMVCENQSLSRRIPKEERMVYIDWNDGNGDNHVGFLLGSISIQVPRFSTFGNRQSKPFYTELCVYQSNSGSEEDGATSSKPAYGSLNGISAIDEMDNMKFPDVVCSRICRLYNAEGQLKQGCTSFYTLRRFGPETEP